MGGWRRKEGKGGEEESILLMQMRPWTMMMLASAKCAKRTCEDGRKGKEEAFSLAAIIAVLAAIRVLGWDLLLPIGCVNLR